MSLRKARAAVTLVAIAAACGLWCGLLTRAETGAFAPFVVQSLPQRASGDFDGDGRVDNAQIQDFGGLKHVSVRLSGSSDDVRLDTAVAVLIDEDVDHDGDLDLVAATAAGDVVIWLNDGHGRFTREVPSQSRSVGNESPSLQTEANMPSAIGIAPPFVPGPERSETAVVVVQIRRPTEPLRFDRHRLLPPGLRAPPTRSA